MITKTFQKETLNFVNIGILYTGLFSLHVFFFTLLHLETVSPHLEFTQTQLWDKNYFIVTQ